MTEEIKDGATLEEELLQTQTMLAFVLLITGPVEISKEAAEKGLPKDAAIVVDTDAERNVVTVSLKHE